MLYACTQSRSWLLDLWRHDLCTRPNNMPRSFAHHASHSSHWKSGSAISMCVAVNIQDSSWFSYAQVQLKPARLPPSFFFNPEIMNGFRRNVTYIKVLHENFQAKLTFQSLAVSLRTTRFNIQKFYMALALRWVFCTDIRTDSDVCFIQH